MSSRFRIILAALAFVCVGASNACFAQWGQSFMLAANLAISITSSQSPAAQTPGPSAALYANNPYYTCNTNRYVSTTGNSSNNGLTPGSPWDMTTANQADLTASGPGSWCINVAPGVYNTSSIFALTISHGGNAASQTGYVVWRCTSMPFSFSSVGALQGEGSGSACIIRDDVGTDFRNAINLNAAYVMLDGFELDGNNALCVECGGLSIQRGNNTHSLAGLDHHVWLMNSVVHGWGSSGIQLVTIDWAFFLHNAWHDNASRSTFQTSGLSDFNPVGFPVTYTPTAQDLLWHSNTTGLQYHKVYAYNVGYNNFDPQSGSSNSDGEGIILDSWGHSQSGYECTNYSGVICPYTDAALVMGNIMYHNGGFGIETFEWSTPGGALTTAPVTIVNNTVFDNNWDTHNSVTTDRGGMYGNIMMNTRWINNISYAVRGAGVTAGNLSFVGTCDPVACPSPNNVWQSNVSFPAGATDFRNGNTYTTGAPPNNLDGTNPLFVSATPGSLSNNFALQSGSAARGRGQAFDLWQQSGTVDVGACVGSVTHCP